jgi:hypothetical protein
MFEPNPAAPHHRARGVRGRWREAIEANVKREQEDEEARELQKQAEEAKTLRMREEAEIKQKLESHYSENESEDGGRSGVWDMGELDTDEEDGGNGEWKVFTELKRIRRESAGNGRDMVLVCCCVLFSMLVVIIMFWVKWL